MGWVVSVTPWVVYPREGDPVPIVQEAVWTPDTFGTGTENFAPHRDSIPGQSTL